jgi:hypothetical protein
MKNYIVFGALWICASATVCAQGVFIGSNASARTRLVSFDGPLAGTNIMGQMLAGANPSSLQPVTAAIYHYTGGVFAVPSAQVTVPDVPPNQFAYVQLLAWDSIFWGSSLAGVPTDQLGRTDVVTVFLTTGVFPDTAYLPRFTQPAIVPPIPEPSVWALGVLALGALGMRRFVTKAIK